MSITCSVRDLIGCVVVVVVGVVVEVGGGGGIFVVVVVVSMKALPVLSIEATLSVDSIRSLIFANVP